jgi:hypothetical protein
MRAPRRPCPSQGRTVAVSAAVAAAEAVLPPLAVTATVTAAVEAVMESFLSVTVKVGCPRTWLALQPVRILAVVRWLRNAVVHCEPGHPVPSHRDLGLSTQCRRKQQQQQQQQQQFQCRLVEEEAGRHRRLQTEAARPLCCLARRVPALRMACCRRHRSPLW